MKNLHRAAAVAAVLLALVLPAVNAGAQDYPTPSPFNTTTSTTPGGGGSTTTTPGGPTTSSVPGDVDDNDDEGGVPVGVPGSAETTLPPGEVIGETNTAAPGSAEAPSGGLPVTGGDVVGMALIGAAAVGIGIVLVKRSRSMKGDAA